ncbi:MAG: dTMP kinase [Candidatus Woesearchaeota archaeon]
MDLDTLILNTIEGFFPFVENKIYPYIVFEGIVGCGKSTQARLLFSFLNEKYPNSVLLTKEPGGSEVADSIRKIAQGTSFNEEMNPYTEAYLYAASRAQTLRNVVLPNLNQGKIVISDRSFLSSLAFQGYGRNLGFENVLLINKVAVSVMPGLVIYLDVPPEIAVKRANDKKGDKFESMNLEFHNRVLKGYEEIFKRNLVPYVKIDGNRKIEQVFEDVKKSALSFLEKINY